MNEPAADPRRISRNLTDVLQRSGLGQRVDPKGFYMLLRSNFEALHRPGSFDLAPLWGSIKAQAEDDESLPGLFLGFAEVCQVHGLEPRLPPSVAGLEEDARQAALERTFGAPTEEAVIETIPASDLLFSTDELPSLSSQDLLPIVSDERRREITTMVVQSLKSSEVGPLIDGAQLAYRIDEYFSELCDGRSFDLRPVFDGLREVEGFSDRGAYVGLVRMQHKLREREIELVLPDLDVPEDERAELLEQAEASEKLQRRRSSHSRDLGVQREASTSRDLKASTRSLDLPPGTTRREERLRRYGLLGISPQRWRAVRIAVMSALLVAGSVFAFLTRPNRDFDPDRFPIPLTKAGMVDGLFVGTLDDQSWYRVPVRLREQRLAAMSRKLVEEGLEYDARIVDAKGRLVIRSQSDGKLQGARFVLESPDGVKPPPQGKPLDPKDLAKEGAPPPATPPEPDSAN